MYNYTARISVLSRKVNRDIAFSIPRFVDSQINRHDLISSLNCKLISELRHAFLTGNRPSEFNARFERALIKTADSICNTRREQGQGIRFSALAADAEITRRDLITRRFFLYIYILKTSVGRLIIRTRQTRCFAPPSIERNEEEKRKKGVEKGGSTHGASPFITNASNISVVPEGVINGKSPPPLSSPY